MAHRPVPVPGGARIAGTISTEPGFLDKSEVERPRKRAMAAEAVRLVQDGMTGYLDAGTTLLAMAPALARLPHLTVVANDSTTIGRPMDAGNLELVHVGGRGDVSNRSSPSTAPSAATGWHR
ncbi:DeoR/GlpR family DNA-binding transcription regulator [Streptomyces tendae]|uniref:hypothetical protein n=1 Tax=Streptomyces tendae TaxID=1932 RepID=UPI00371A23EA